MTKPGMDQLHCKEEGDRPSLFRRRGNETSTFSKKRERDSISVSKSVCCSRHKEECLLLIKGDGTKGNVKEKEKRKREKGKKKVKFQS
jgi:hypothetical protein